MPMNIRWGHFEAELRAIPRNSVYGQYLPWDFKEHTYTLSNFDQNLAQGLVSREELRLMLRLLRQSNYYQVDQIPWSCWAIPLVILVLIVAISVVGAVRPSTTLTRNIQLACLILLLILPVLLMILAKRTSHARDSARVTNLKLSLRRIQSQLFADRPVDLRISSLGAYLIIDTSNAEPLLTRPPAQDKPPSQE